MIFFKPTASSDNNNVVEFEAIENDIVSGKCLLLINGDKAEVSQMNCDSDKLYLVEGLVKSAFNYAALKKCYMGYCKSGKYSLILDGMNFEKHNGVYFNDIPSILSGNCCKKH